MQRRNTWSRWWPAAVAAVVVVAGAGAGVALTRGGGSSPEGTASSGGGGGNGATSTTVPVSVLSARLAAAISVQPASGATAVAPNTPVQVTTSTGRLTSVSVAYPGGTPVPGTLDATGQKWVAAPMLEAAEQYTVTATVQNADGLTGTSTSTFTTASATYRLKDILLPNTGTTVGVGQPVVVKFEHSITDPAARASILSHFTITESQPVPGGWYWFSPRELHFRPQAFWPVGEKVTVSSNLAGWDAGGGMWGSGVNSISFAIGDSHVSVANLTTHQMTVSDNGRVIYTFPISAGRDQYPTMNGIHIAMDKEPVVHMVSSTVGIPVNSPNGYDELVYNDVHISDSGEYVHAAPWSVGDQGRTNVSHGCINLSTANSLTFYNFSQVGDVIEVVDGTRPPVPGDHGVMDWDTDWSLWTPGTVTPATPPPTTTPATTATTAAPATSPTTAAGAPAQAAIKPN